MIRRLDPVTIGQIAAGEVIERPVSVVKELVENALDAQATRITVSVTGGGFDEIDVSDDGIGIAPDELPLAVERHATSKLLDAHGLESLDTLGFRGEGLASIAAIARVTITSRRRGDEFASRIEAFEDQVSPVHMSPGPLGTRITVKDLFINVPVRREYLRSAQAEATRIANFITTLALGYPEVAFVMHIDGRESFSLPPATQGIDRLAHVFGRDVYERMIALEPISTGMHGTITGYVSRPGFDRGDRRMQLLFVNGRVLKTTALSGAWSGGYSGYSMVGRHPYGVIFLNLPPDHVDPNVHPTKSEVRFRYNAQVVDAVRRAIVTTLHRDASKRLGEAISLAPQTRDERSRFGNLVRETNDEPFSSSRSWQNSRRLAVAQEQQTIFGETSDTIVKETAVQAFSATPVVVSVQESFVEALPQPRNLRVLAQLDRAFILATDGRAIVIVDQHAAHERIAFESISAASRAQTMTQPMLVPDVIELERSDAEKLQDSLEALQAIGVEIEAFGERAYRIIAMPAILAGRHFDVRGYLDDLEDETPGLDAREHIWATMACHSVVRAGEVMEVAEMQTVIDRLAGCENPMHCPHGRPTIVRFDAPQIARLFKRV